MISPTIAQMAMMNHLVVSKDFFHSSGLGTLVNLYILAAIYDFDMEEFRYAWQESVSSELDGFNWQRSVAQDAFTE